MRIVEFNVENLFVFLDQSQEQDLAALGEKEWRRLSSSTIPNKPLGHVRQIASVISELNPDVLMLCEVGGRESLNNFNQTFLNGRYESLLIEGNSNRGIDLAYMVRKDLPFSFDLISHRHREIDFLYPHEMLSRDTGYEHLRSARRTSHRFSRDVLELRVMENEGDRPVAIFLLVHLKSQLDRDRIDPGGRDRRRAETNKLVKIYNEIDAEFDGLVPVLLGGDFNGVAALPQPDAEFAAVYNETQLRDCLEIAEVPPDERFTHQKLYTRRAGRNIQLDYLFVPPSLKDRVNAQETWVYRFRDEKGITRVVPRNLNEKRSLPSDHFPVVLTLDPVSATSSLTL